MDHYKDKIFSFYQRYKRMPSYSEIMKATGLKSKNAVYKLVNKLVEEGIIGKDSQGKLLFKRTYGEIPLLGVVEAGMPTYAEEEVLNTISIDDLLVENKAHSYILEVKGDSMIEAHIEEGDMVIVERKILPRAGDIVIAEVDGGWTMKYLRFDKRGKAYLEPANKNYKPIYPEEELKIAAVVRAVIRKY